MDQKIWMHIKTREVRKGFVLHRAWLQINTVHDNNILHNTVAICFLFVLVYNTSTGENGHDRTFVNGPITIIYQTNKSLACYKICHVMSQTRVKRSMKSSQIFSCFNIFSPNMIKYIYIYIFFKITLIW